MKLYVADTHALFWYLTASPKLGTDAKAAFDEGVQGQAVILVPSIVLAELYFLNEKAGQPLVYANEYGRLSRAGQFQFVPLTASDVAEFGQDRSIPEMHDRIIVGVARRTGAICMTRDVEIQTSGLVPTIW